MPQSAETVDVDRQTGASHFAPKGATRERAQACYKHVAPTSEMNTGPRVMATGFDETLKALLSEAEFTKDGNR